MDALRILAVEDNPADFRLLREYLSADPATRFELVNAQTLQEALASLSEGAFDAVLLDMNLPDSMGLSGLDRIIAHSPTVPVVVLTGQQDAATGDLAIAHNAQDYLVKGQIDSAVLVRSIRYAIERNKARETAQRLVAEVDRRAAELQQANEALEKSRLAALNLMDDAIQARNQAERSRAELASAAQALRENEQQIRRQVEELRAANEDLSRFNRVAVDRELRMVQLKKQVNELCEKAGIPPRYRLDFMEKSQ
jgi:DNA-binding NarL/FixJ family response regulator